jgi:hypothetical protein
MVRLAGVGRSAARVSKILVICEGVWGWVTPSSPKANHIPTNSSQTSTSNSNYFLSNQNFIKKFPIEPR